MFSEMRLWNIEEVAPDKLLKRLSPFLRKVSSKISFLYSHLWNHKLVFSRMGVDLTEKKKKKPIKVEQSYFIKNFIKHIRM